MRLSRVIPFFLCAVCVVAHAGVFSVRYHQSIFGDGCFGALYALGQEHRVSHDKFARTGKAALSLVYEIYESIFKANQRSKVFTRNFLEEIKRDDSAAPELSTIYTVKVDDNSGGYQGALRAYLTYLDESDGWGGQAMNKWSLAKKRAYASDPATQYKLLPLERKFPQLLGQLEPYRVELGRLATREGTDRRQIMNELAYEVLREEGPLVYRYRLNMHRPLYVYVHADSKTMPIFTKLHGMKIVYGPDVLEAPDQYVLKIEAKTLFIRLCNLLGREYGLPK